MKRTFHFVLLVTMLLGQIFASTGAAAEILKRCLREPAHLIFSYVELLNFPSKNSITKELSRC